MRRRFIFMALVMAMTLAGFAPQAQALNTASATCAVNVHFDFSPALTTTLTNGSVNFGITSIACVGTALLAPFSMGGSMSGLRSCQAMLLSGLAGFSYPDAGNGASVVYAGSAASGDLIIAPASAIVVGTTALAGVMPATSCTVPSGLSSMNYLGSVTFFDPVI